MTAPKIRKKRVKRVNWTYVPVNSTDLVHVDDFTIAAMAESSVEPSVERRDEPIVQPMDEPRGEPCNERSVDERSVERSAEPIVELNVEPSGEVVVGFPDPFRVLSPVLASLGLPMLSEREADEMALHGEVLRFSPVRSMVSDPGAAVNDSLAQKFGVNAIGEFVCRDFGPDGMFQGRITAYHLDNEKKGLYTVQYTDNDIEDLDEEEYNYAYSLWLEEEGWEVEEEDGADQLPFVHTTTLICSDTVP